MPGPAPKPAATRRRRNRPKASTKPAAAAAAAAAKTPKLPKRAGAAAKRRPLWLAETREWWETIHASPAARLWLPADRFALVRLAILYDEVLRGEDSITVLREVTALEDRLGLNPLARQRLHFEPDPPTGPEGAEELVDDVGGEDERWARAAG